MRQKIIHGAEIDFVTPDEVVKLLARPEASDRVRASQTIALDANGNGTSGQDTDDLYTCPSGMEFELRRISLTISGATGPNDGNIPLNVAGKWLAILRSGTLIEYANPASAAGVPSIPGMQSWAKEQGPYLRNGEALEIQAHGLTANGFVTVWIEGIQKRPSTEPRK